MFCLRLDTFYFPYSRNLFTHDVVCVKKHSLSIDLYPKCNYVSDTVKSVSIYGNGWCCGSFKVTVIECADGKG